MLVPDLSGSTNRAGKLVPRGGRVGKGGKVVGRQNRAGEGGDRQIGPGRSGGKLPL